MKNKFLRKKIAVAAVTSAMVLNSVPAMGAGFADTNNHWANKQIDKWSNYGIVNGYEGNFNPDSSITRGEMAVIIDRIMNYQTSAKNNFKDLDKNYYTDSILKIYNAGVMNGDGNGNVNPKDNITREQAAVLLAKAFSVDAAEGKTSFKDNSKISSWAMPYVTALTNKGYINGKPDGTFAPQDNLTRAEAITIIDNMLETLYSKAGVDDAKLTIEGTVVVNTPNVTLKNKIIAGDLIIAEGVGEGDLSLEDVTVLGKVIVKGGGENSIHIIGSSSIVSLVVAKIDGSVRIAVSGWGLVKTVYIEDGKNDVILTGEIGNVEVNTPNAQVIALNAKIDNMAVKAENSKVVLADSAKVEKLSVDEKAKNTNLNIQGEVSKVEVSAPEVELKVDGTIEKITATDKATGLEVKGDGEVKEAEVKADDVTISTDGTKIESDKEVAGDTSKEDKKDDSNSGSDSDDNNDADDDSDDGLEDGDDDSSNDDNEESAEAKLAEAKKMIEALNLNMTMTEAQIKAKVNALSLPEGVKVDFTIEEYTFVIITLDYNGITDSVVISVEDKSDIVKSICAEIAERRFKWSAVDYKWDEEARRAFKAEIQDIIDKALSEGIAVNISGGRQYLRYSVTDGTYSTGTYGINSNEAQEIADMLSAFRKKYSDGEFVNENGTYTIKVGDTVYTEAEVKADFETIKEKISSDDKYYQLAVGMGKIKDAEGNVEAIAIYLERYYTSYYMREDYVERGGTSYTFSSYLIISKDKYLVSASSSYFDVDINMDNKEVEAVKNTIYYSNGDTSTLNYVVLEKGKAAEIVMMPKEENYRIITRCTMNSRFKPSISEDGKYIFTISAEDSAKLSSAIYSTSTSSTYVYSRIASIIRGMDLSYSVKDENAVEKLKEAIESQEEIAGLMKKYGATLEYTEYEGYIRVYVKCKYNTYEDIISKELKELEEYAVQEVSAIKWTTSEEVSAKIDEINEKLYALVQEKLGVDKSLVKVYKELDTGKEIVVYVDSPVDSYYDIIIGNAPEGQYYVKPISSSVSGLDYEYFVDGKSIGKEGYVEDGKEVVVKFTSTYKDFKRIDVYGSNLCKYDFDNNEFSAYVDGEMLKFSISNFTTTVSASERVAMAKKAVEDLKLDASMEDSVIREAISKLKEEYNQKYNVYLYVSKNNSTGVCTVTVSCEGTKDTVVIDFTADWKLEKAATTISSLKLDVSDDIEAKIKEKTLPDGVTFKVGTVDKENLKVVITLTCDGKSKEVTLTLSNNTAKKEYTATVKSSSVSEMVYMSVYNGQSNKVTITINDDDFDVAKGVYGTVDFTAEVKVSGENKTLTLSVPDKANVKDYVVKFKTGDTGVSEDALSKVITLTKEIEDGKWTGEVVVDYTKDGGAAIITYDIEVTIKEKL